MAVHPSQLVRSLYVHVPFCAQKCHYCAFYSEASSGDLMNRYTAALNADLRRAAANLQPRTVFFGGGTPSILTAKQWQPILETVRSISSTPPTEWTIECNPATVSLEKARLWRDHGVNRISMGVQSLDEQLLDRLGRVHDRSMVFKSLDTFRKAGFDNINIDLMFAIPGQTLRVWQETLNEAISLQTEHLSSYEVIYEEDTALYQQLKAGEFDVDEDLACSMHELLVDSAEAAGLGQYEVANFARGKSADPRAFPSRACQHNINYWLGGEYAGLGPSACGYIRGERTRNWANTQMWCELVEKGKPTAEWKETLDPLPRAGEIAAFGLRTRPGWSFALFHETTGFDLRKDWREELQDLEQRGWAMRDHTSFRLTREGLRFADAAAEMMLR
ncbi:MAG: radical SAM family heme chaperone HemW [Verrucomicrobia bacterium]|nr:radical SAM family heme chaperone HemW [Verrucomicrobiota bacterium]